MAEAASVAAPVPVISPVAEPAKEAVSESEASPPAEETTPNRGTPAPDEQQDSEAPAESEIPAAVSDYRRKLEDLERSPEGDEAPEKKPELSSPGTVAETPASFYREYKPYIGTAAYIWVCSIFS